MISLGNTYNEEDLVDFDERVKRNIKNTILSPDSMESGLKVMEYILEFKFDGLGVELIYKN
jgi:DNA ligase (NAD+)